MNIHFAPAARERRVKIKVVGVGGAGGNAVNRMVEAGLADIDFFAVNTDSQALESSRAHQTVVIGNRLTRGLGAGGDPDVGRQAAEEDRELLSALVEDTDMVFVTAGMGGGTGTGAAPLIAEVARQQGALTVAIVTRPFEFEGARRMAQAVEGLEALRGQVDALLVIPNERLMEIDVPDSGMTTVFQIADDVLYQATRGISDIIAQRAIVNLDFADVRTVMKDSGAAIMGTGRAAGEGRARRAADQAICSPLLENVDILGSRAVLVYLTAACVNRDDLREAMGHVQQAAGNDAHIFFGFANDEGLGEDLLVTVIATGFPARPGEGRPVLSVRAAAPVTAPEAPLATPVEAEPTSDKEESNCEDNAVITYDHDVCEPDEKVALRGDDLMPEPEPIAVPAGAGPAARVEAWREDPALGERGAAAVRQAPAVDANLPADRAEAAAAHVAAAPLAAMAAAAGSSAAGQDRDATVVSSRRFLDPLGSVKLQGQPEGPPAAGQRFRVAALGEDLLRPAWERKYVD